jgi:hypothetical protein
MLTEKTKPSKGVGGRWWWGVGRREEWEGKGNGTRTSSTVATPPLPDLFKTATALLRVSPAADGDDAQDILETSDSVTICEAKTTEASLCLHCCR